ncbi:MAG: nicotinate-nucleotide adenylyltransferase [Schwartzia succinivorans]|nr:nicotinate-nucleotide adenylyltransferase [Schwartzia succinivorans]
MAETKHRVGILGGTFDPIHNGHLMMAEAVRDEYEMEKVLFIPAAQPPHKRGHKISPAEDRYMMTVLATCMNPAFEVSDIEMRREGLSYSIDTVRALLRATGGDSEFFFIAGTDVIREIHTWERIEELLDICPFIAASRPGCRPDVERTRNLLGDLGVRQIHLLNTPELEISSTDIRERVAAGRSIKYIVPSEVEHYIYKKGLYR